MGKKQLHDRGPLGLDATEWNLYAVDGDGDGRIRRADPVDSAATLARLIWSRGSLSAGLFTHNQAEWYVQEVLREADEVEGDCKSRYVDWALAPLGSGLETAGPSAVLDGLLASAPESAPPAVKAAIAAANSITSTPYVWGGGHGSWYSYGYDCSGAVSFALYGGGLLEHPAHLRLAGELRRRRPRQVDHDLRQRHPRLHDDRRPALRHGRQRARCVRPALACRASVSRRLRRAASRRVLSSATTGYTKRPWRRSSAPLPETVAQLSALRRRQCLFGSLRERGT